MSALTAKELAKILAAKYPKVTFHWDADLGIKLNPSGRHLYVVQCRHAGKSVRRTIGEVSKLGLTDVLVEPCVRHSAS
jgi:hypothetical protein